jgi:hypothetical protein
MSRRHRGVPRETPAALGWWRALTEGRARVALGGAAALSLVVAQVLLVRAQPWTQDLRAFLLIELVSLGLHAVAVFGLVASRGRRALLLTLAPALLMRAVLLGTSPELSDDVWRYLWEGRVSQAGFNPLVLAPGDERLAALRDATFERVAHREIPSVYPPLAQLLFRVAAMLHLDDRGLRILLVIAELLAMGVLVRALRGLDLPEGQLAIYALHPIPALELASSGHIDGLALPFFALSLLALIGRRPIGAGVHVALAALAKLQAACLAPLLLILRRGALAAVVAATLVVVAYLPFAQPGFLGGLARYGAQWSFNGLVFDPLGELAVFLRTQLVAYADRAHGAWGSIAYHTDPRMLARALLVLVWCGATLVILRVRASMQARAVSLCAVTLLLSPTVYPWYAIPLLAALALWPVAPLMLLTGSLVLSYEVLPRYSSGGSWHEQHWVRIAEYGPALAWLSVTLIAGSWRGRRGSGDAAGGAGGDRDAPGQDAA